MPKLALPETTDDARRKRIEDVLYFWIERLGLETEWSISYSLTSRFPKVRTKGVFARVTTNSPYRRAVIEYVRKSLDSSTDDELADSTVHELAHLLLDPVTQAIKVYIGDSYVATEILQTLETVCDQVAFRFRLVHDGYHRPYYDPYIEGRVP